MATSSTMHIDPKLRPVFGTHNLTAEAASAASECLQKNHDQHHIFFNDDGFHNHIAHHIPSIFALGATPATIKRQYEDNASYQLPPKALHQNIVNDMRDFEVFHKYLGKRDHYHDYLAFFQKEIDSKGWQSVLNEQFFSRTERSDDMLVRLLGGLNHPFIHLGFGVEFEQPAIIAEALAETAVHGNELRPYLLPAEDAANQFSPSQSTPLMDLLEEVRNNKALSSCITEKDSSGSKLQMVIKRQGKELISIASKFRVKPEEIEAKMREEIEVCMYYTFASQRPDKAVKVDFFHMHDTNLSIFIPRFMSASWLSPENKCRILEWKGRLDLANYVARACAELRRDEITNYAPKAVTVGKSKEQQWQEIFHRVNELEDEDGHAPKLVRVCAAGDQMWKTGQASGVINQDMWLKMAHMAIDSTDSKPKWVRSTGLDSAWDEIRSRDPKLAASL